jgi:hypothetical protein
MSLYSFWCVFFLLESAINFGLSFPRESWADVMCRLPCNQPPPPASPNNNKPYSPLFISYFIPTLCLVYRPWLFLFSFPRQGVARALSLNLKLK